MADRDVRVRLSAQVANYIAGMQAAAAATDRVGTSGANLTKLGTQLQGVGRTLSMGLTAPMVAAGAAAVTMSNRFSTSFTRMTTLAGIGTGELGKMRDAVLALSSETGRGPQELADALYVASSSGLDARQSLDAVTIAAKGAASGLGATEDIISLVASATASYGAANMDAATATDILVGTIREGRADPDELAGSLGRILPVAANLGVSFEEVGGSVAFLSNIMGDTNMTITSLGDLMTKLQSPTQQGRAALEQYGSSMEQLHSIIAEDGLLGAMQHLRDIGLSDDPLAFRAVFEDVQAQRGALAMIANLEGLESAIDGVRGSSGALEEAWQAAQGEEGFKMAQAWAEIQVALVEFGDAIAPVAADVAGGVAAIARAFASLPDGVQMAITGVLIAVGPLAMIAGSVMKSAQTIAAARGLIAGSGVAGFLPAALVGAAWMEAGSNPTGFWGDLEYRTDPNNLRFGGFNPLERDTYVPTVRPRASVSPTAITPEIIGNVPDVDSRFMPSVGHGDFTGVDSSSNLSQSQAIMDAVLAQQRARASAARESRNQDQLGGLTPYARDMDFTEYINGIVRAAQVTQAFNDVVASTDWGAAALAGAQTAMSQYTSDLFASTNTAMASEQAFADLGASIRENGFTFDVATEAGRANQSVLQQLASTLDTEFVSAYENANGSQEAFMASATKLGTQTLTRLQAELGLTDEQTAQLATTLGLTATDYEARFKLSGTEEARIRLGLLSGVIGLLQEDVQREVAMRIATGDFNGALKTVQANIAATPSEKKVTITAVDNASRTIGGIAGALFGLRDKTVTVTAKQVGAVGVKMKALGGYVDGPEFAMIGEAGPEVVLPLSRPDRMRQLLTDPRVMTPLSAAMAGNGGSTSSGGGAAGINLVVNAGMGTDGYRVGQQIVDALAKYTRVNGPGAMQRLAS